MWPIQKMWIYIWELLITRQCVRASAEIMGSKHKLFQLNGKIVQKISPN